MASPFKTFQGAAPVSDESTFDKSQFFSPQAPAVNPPVNEPRLLPVTSTLKFESTGRSQTTFSDLQPLLRARQSGALADVFNVAPVDSRAISEHSAHQQLQSRAAERLAVLQLQLQEDQRIRQLLQAEQPKQSAKVDDMQSQLPITTTTVIASTHIEERTKLVTNTPAVTVTLLSNEEKGKRSQDADFAQLPLLAPVGADTRSSLAEKLAVDLAPPNSNINWLVPYRNTKSGTS